MKLLTKTNDPNASLGVVERTVYMLGNAGTALINTIIASFILFYYTDVLGLNSGIIGTIMLVSRLFDGVTDVFMGMIVDRTHSKHGRARIWVLRMCVPFAISGILMMTVPSHTSEIIKYVYVAITYNLCNSICLTALYVPYNAMTSNLTANPVERGILGVFVMFGAVIGTMGVQSTVDAATKALGGDQRAWIIVIAVYAVIGCLLHLLCFFGTKERTGQNNEYADHEKVDTRLEMQGLFKNKYWLITIAVVFSALLSTALLGSGGMYFAKAALGDTKYYASIANTVSVAQMVALIVSAMLMKKIHKRDLCMYGLFVLAGGSLLSGMFVSNYPIFLVGAAMRGIGAGMAGAVLYGLVADTIDYGEWMTGQKSEGVGFAAMTVATKLANGLGVVIIGWINQLFGYDPNAAVQTARAIAGVNLSFNYLPAVFCLISGLLMLRYDLDKRFPAIQAELSERRSAARKA